MKFYLTLEKNNIEDLEKKDCRSTAHWVTFETLCKYQTHMNCFVSSKHIQQHVSSALNKGLKQEV